MSKSSNTAELVSIESIFRDGRHNAFLGFAQWRGAYHLSFRNARGHIGDDAAQLILQSVDGKDWRRAYHRQRPADEQAASYDFRDSYLLPEDDRLLLYSCETAVSGEGERHTYTQLQVLEPGEEWGDPQIVVPTGVAWKPIRIADSYLAATYKRTPGHGGPQVHALSAADGVHWREVSVIGPGTETVLCPWPDGSVLALVRTEQPPYYLQFYRSTAPYDHWEHVGEHRQIIQGQELFTLNGAWYLLGRHRPDYRLTADPQRPSFGSHRLRLWRLGHAGQLQELLELPSAGDCGYPGAAVEPDGTVLVAYYSQHETGQADRWSDVAQADLYLARIRIA